MSASIDEIREDIAELKRLLESSTRNAVKQFLISKISACENEVKVAEVKQAAAAKIEESVRHERAGVAARLAAGNAESLSTFGWDQSEKNVSVYISDRMEGLTSDNVEAEFTANSFTVRITTGSGKKFVLSRTTSGDIVADKSKAKVKTDRVTLVMRKTAPGHWDGLERSSKSGKTQAASSPAADPTDPGAGIMDIMKKMYDEGDVATKQMIGKAWTESREKTGAGGGDGFEF